MAMVHNQVIAGGPEAMLELLRVPSRFPDARESHVANWQESMIAWWWSPEKRPQMTVSFGRVSREEMRSMRSWLQVRDKERSREKARALDEIEDALKAFPA